jgi:hypothetical protein
MVVDSEMKWCNQMTYDIHYAKKALNAINFKRKFFYTKKPNNLITSNFYSIFYYSGTYQV